MPLKKISGQTKFSDHMFEENPSFAPLENTISIRSTIQKRKYLGTVEKFCIYKAIKRGIQLIDNITINRNSIFYVIAYLLGLYRV